MPAPALALPTTGPARDGSRTNAIMLLRDKFLDRMVEFDFPGAIAHAAELGSDAPPDDVAAPFGDARQQESEPGQQHMSADAGLDAVEHGAQLEGGT
ncbi:MAG: hypothetical protein ACRD0G_02575 [Acidimicrobiales bacterium]